MLRKKIDISGPLHKCISEEKEKLVKKLEMLMEHPELQIDSDTAFWDSEDDKEKETQ